MRAEDLRPEELIRTEPVNGLPFFGSARLVVTGAGPFLSRLGTDLMDRLGEPTLQAIFFRFGYEAGLGMATSLSEIYQWESDLEWFKAGTVVRRWAGLGVEEITDLDFDRAAGRCRFRGLWRESFQVRLHPSDLRPPARRPVCSILAGAASGYASACLGREVLVRETDCAVHGASVCRFEGRPVEEWGLTAEQLRSQYSLPEVNDEVGRLRLALTTTRGQLQAQQDELERLRARAATPRDTGFVHRSAAMERVLQLCLKAAPTPSSLLLVGETGTGKEVLARFIHRHSGRASQPYLAVNCAALPPNLLESELFGHVKGSFTGADRDRQGLFVEAGSGTLFLDEVGELPLELQAKLLRALQEREVRPVGGNQSRPMKARVVSATNRDLKEMVAEGGFREDLYYRLAVIPVPVPPLRQRREDILPLARHFLERLRPQGPGLSPEAVRRLEAHAWPGNVRELENALEYASVLAGDQVICSEHLPADLNDTPAALLDHLAGDLPNQEELVRRYTAHVLARTGGRKAEAARILGIGQNTLWRRLKEPPA